jgi:epoxyqueuosine reductase
VSTSTAGDSLLTELRRLGAEAGLVEMGVAPVERFDRTREDLVERRRQGLHAGMQFTYRDPDRSTDPARLLAGARSLVVGAIAYPAGTPAPPSFPGPAGRVARYASLDHYGRLRRALEVVAARLESAGHRARIVLDDNALVDRAAAHRAGIGWWGHNTNLLSPEHGSWIVLGSVVTDADLPPSTPVPDGCGPCRRCLDGCPTGAIVAPGVLDARRCLAWLVQAEGPFPVEHRVALGDRIYGCDDCQEVCPPSRRAPAMRAAVEGEPWVDLLHLLAADDAELLDRHGRWYVPRRDPRYLRRNAIVALGNTAAPDDVAVITVLRRFADGDDELLAEHAQWALVRLTERSDGTAP